MTEESEQTNARICPECQSEIPAGSPDGVCPKCMLNAGIESAPPSDPAQTPTQISPVSGASGFEAPSVDELSELLPQLDILELLGKGGMGAVYRAKQRDLDRQVAVKILPAESGQDAAFTERFQREARSLAKLNHPNIVTVHDFGRAGDVYFFVMEFVDGTDLRQTIQSGGVTPEQALAIVPQVCDALQFAHDEGIVHRDIKPENILIDKHGRVKIADFGLAKLMGQEQADVALTATHQVMGTLRYMAPEQMEGSKTVDRRADIYSLGVVFYELLTGELPMGWFAPPSKKVQVDVGLDEVVLRTLEKEPERRFQHASEVKSAVEAASRIFVNPPAGAPQQSAPMVRTHKLVDDTETRVRRLFHGIHLVGFLALVSTPLAFAQGVPFGIAAIATAFALMTAAEQVKKRLKWTTTYKGHTIELRIGPLAEKLYLDGGLVATGGFGVKMELRAPINAGNGAGDEIVVWVDARMLSVRCRIEVEERIGGPAS